MVDLNQFGVTSPRTTWWKLWTSSQEKCNTQRLCTASGGLWNKGNPLQSPHWRMLDDLSVLTKLTSFIVPRWRCPLEEGKDGDMQSFQPPLESSLPLSRLFCVSFNRLVAKKGFDASREKATGYGQMLGILYIFFWDHKYFHALKLFFLFPDVSLNLPPITHAHLTILSLRSS